MDGIIQLQWAMTGVVRVHNHLNARCEVMRGRSGELAKEYCPKCLDTPHMDDCIPWWSLNRYRFQKGYSGRMVNYES